LDPVGAVLSLAGLVALTYGMIEAPERGWASVATLGMVGGVAARSPRQPRPREPWLGDQPPGRAACVERVEQPPSGLTVGMRGTAGEALIELSIVL
jgi:hypothetical protein